MTDEDDRVSIPLPFEDAVRGLLQVNPEEDLPPEDKRCPYCGGRGWLWHPPAPTAPPLPSAWQLCRACNGTGLEVWTKTTPQRPEPTAPPTDS